ncbi:hypothetical protein POM88_025947 [Heracleum sosnowskyi]|uniref:Helitron helicase-like domain-containing protein n=1 Tax=Heracleum sosnowskyi TaxID=360622 RepID=A0AAD8MPE4_9APIA|nr:hypothetical protein POM88_025947 [Heracleum sosnowskyi]
MENKTDERGGFKTDEHGDESSEEPWVKYLERNKKQREIYENQIVREMSLSEIMAGKCRIKRDAKMRQDDKERMIRSGSESRKFFVKGRKCKRKEPETREQQDQRNKKREAKYIKAKYEQFKQKLIVSRNRFNHDARNQQSEFQPSLPLVFGDSTPVTTLPPLSKRMRTKINGIKEKFASSDEILNIGSADKICCDCGALMWRFEQTKKQKRTKSNKFYLCCGNGKVRLPLLRETPPELKTLLDGANNKSTSFRKSLRLYNNAFAFTSVGGNVDREINNGGGPYVYRIFGEVYHQIGSLHLEGSKKAVFSQIYMYDNQQQLEERLNFPNGDNRLDVEITESLSAMLNRDNALVDIYRNVRDRFKDTDIVPAQLQFRNETTIDANGYPVYRRRNDKRIIQLKEIEIDNLFVVPYNRGLIVKYQAHMNIEWCNQGLLIKYMFKYITKGPDRATIAIGKFKDANCGEGKVQVQQNTGRLRRSCSRLRSSCSNSEELLLKIEALLLKIEELLLKL